VAGLRQKHHQSAALGELNPKPKLKKTKDQNTIKKDGNQHSQRPKAGRSGQLRGLEDQGEDDSH
jgi:hypothetical protein